MDEIKINFIDHIKIGVFIAVFTLFMGIGSSWIQFSGQSANKNSNQIESVNLVQKNEVFISEPDNKIKLSLQIDDSQPQVSENFRVDFYVDPGEEIINGVDLQLVYATNELQFEASGSGINRDYQELVDLGIDQQDGHITHSIFINPEASGSAEKKLFSSYIFKRLSAESINLKISSNTVLAIDSQTKDYTFSKTLIKISISW